MKPSKLNELIRMQDPDKSDRYVGYFKDLFDMHTHKTLADIFSAAGHKDDDGLPAPYNNALLTAKADKAHAIDETLIAPVIREENTTLLKKHPEPVLRAISLSNSTVLRRIDETTSDTKLSLCNKLLNIDFSLQLDKSTLSNNFLRYWLMYDLFILAKYIRNIYLLAVWKLAQGTLFIKHCEADFL